jgi:DNA-binding transcriptional LysR family regulator
MRRVTEEHMVTLKQVEAFYWASILGSFEAAAEKLNTAQSTISKRIQELEVQSRVMLFDRSKRSVRLTMKGQELLVHAEEMLNKRNAMLGALLNTEAFAGRFCFGVTELIAATWLPHLIARIMDKYPNLILTYEVDLTMNLYERLSNFQVDLVIAPANTMQLDFDSVPLPNLELSWMCSPRLQLPTGRLPVSAMSDYPLLTQSASSAMQMMVTQILVVNHVSVKQVISCNSMAGLAELAGSGFGITCLPTRYYEPEIAAGWLRTFETDPPVPELPYSAFFRRGNADISADIATMAEGVCDFSRPRH